MYLDLTFYLEIVLNIFTDLWCRHLVMLRGIEVVEGAVVLGAVVVRGVVIMEGGMVAIWEGEEGVACPVVLRWLLVLSLMEK